MLKLFGRRRAGRSEWEKRLDETRVPWHAWVVPSHVVAWVLSEVGSWAPAVERKCGTKSWKESTV